MSWLNMLEATHAFAAWSAANTALATTTIMTILTLRADMGRGRDGVTCIDPLQPPRILLLLAIYAKYGAGPRLQAGRVDRLAAVRADAIGAGLNAGQGRVHLIELAAHASFEGQHGLLLESLVGIVRHVVAHAPALGVQVIAIFRDLVLFDIYV